MFYFLEGAQRPALCRSCLVREGGSPPGPSQAALLDSAPADFSEGLAESPGALLVAVRALVQEEVDRIDEALGRVPESDPDLPLLRSLRDETRGHLADGLLVEAVAALIDLRRVLGGLERDPDRLPLTAPWDESVLEMYDRVQARARARVRSLAEPPAGAESSGTASAQPSANSGRAST